MKFAVAGGYSVIDSFDWLTLGVLVGLFVALAAWALWMTRKGGDADAGTPATGNMSAPLGISEPAAAQCNVCGGDNSGMALHWHDKPRYFDKLELTDEMIEAQSWAVHPTWSVKHRWSRIDYVNGATWARDFINESTAAHHD